MKSDDPRFVTEKTHLPDHLRNAIQYAPDLNETAAKRIEFLEQEVERLTQQRRDGFTAASDAQREIQAYDDIMTRQGDMLTRTVNVLKGPPPKLTAWSYHNIPELAQAAVVALEAVRGVRRIEVDAWSDDDAPEYAVHASDIDDILKTWDEKKS